MEKGKIAAVILTISTILAIAGAGTLYYLRDQERQQRIALEVKLVQLKAAKSEVDKKLDSANKNITELSSKLDEADQQVQDLAMGLEAEKKARADLFFQINSLKADVEKERHAKDELSSTLTKKEQDILDYQAKLKQAESKKTSLEEEIKILKAEKEKVELDKIVVKTEPSLQETSNSINETSSQPLEGKVLSINKKYDFVVISLGTKDGVKIGQIFTVYQKDKPLLDVEVEKVYEALSAANILEAKKKDRIREGDKVASK